MTDKTPVNDRENSAKTNRWPSGPQISGGSLVSTGVFFAVFVGLAFLMDSFFILYLVMFIFAATTLIRIVRGKSLVGLISGGEDYWDNYEIKTGKVHCEKDGVAWQEDLANYQDVFWQVKTVKRRHRIGRRHRARRRDDVFQVLELRHSKDRARDVNIYTSQEEKGMRGRWQEAAIAFDLPATRDLGEGTIQRIEACDVGKSLRALADEGLSAGKLNSSSAAPSGVRWYSSDDLVVVHLRRAIVPNVMIALVPVLFAIFVGVMVPADPVLTAIVIALPCAIYGLWLLISYRLKITPETLFVYHQLGPVPLWRSRQAIDDIEGVVIGPALLSWAAVLVDSSHRRLRLHPLSDPVAEWLAQFLRSAIATTPRSPRSQGRRH
jgi:hypothetical protein